jgi:hypothetical protein
MLGAVARLPSWTDLAAIGDKTPQHIRLFIVNIHVLVGAKGALFYSALEAPATTTTATVAISVSVPVSGRPRWPAAPTTEAALSSCPKRVSFSIL